MPLNTYNAATNLFVALPGPVSPPGSLTDADLNAAKAHSDAQAVAAMAVAAAAQSAAVSAAAAAVAANARVIPPAYTLPPATTTALGGFKPGTTLASTADGTTDVVGQTIAQITTVTTPPGTPYVVLFQADGTPTKITLTALQALAGWSGGAGAGVPTLTLTMPTSVQPGTSYTISGTFSNDGTSPVLTISVDAGAFGALPAGSSATSGLITLSMPGIATGTHTVQVKDGNGVLSNTVSFAVTAVETLTVTTPGAQVAGTGFAVAGTYANGTPATLDYSLDGGTTWTAASGPTISGGTYSIPGVVVPAANASQTVRVRDHGAQSVVGVSGAFAVTTAAGIGSYPLAFTGSAGPLTGIRALTAIAGDTVTTAALDGAGNALMPSTTYSRGTLQGAGAIPADCLITATFGPGGPHPIALGRMDAAGTTGVFVLFDISNLLGVSLNNGAQTLTSTLPGTIASATTSVGLRCTAAGTYTAQMNGVDIGSPASMTGAVAATGYVLIGSGDNASPQTAISSVRVV